MEQMAPTAFRSPVYDVRSVPIDKVVANDYNPNSVAPPEMELLEISIWEDGYTQPVVTVYDAENDRYVVVDGFHRFLTLKNSKRIRERERGMLPVVVLDKAMSDRMASIGTLAAAAVITLMAPWSRAQGREQQLTDLIVRAASQISSRLQNP